MKNPLPTIAHSQAKSNDPFQTPRIHFSPQPFRNIPAYIQHLHESFPPRTIKAPLGSERTQTERQRYRYRPAAARAGRVDAQGKRTTASCQACL